MSLASPRLIASRPSTIHCSDRTHSQALSSSPLSTAPTLPTLLSESPPMSHPDSVFNEDSVDEVVEINTIEDEDHSIPTNPMAKTRVQKKRKKTSIVWPHFDEVPSKDPNDKRIWAKCKSCDHKYIANSSHGTGNLQKHMKNCGGKTEHDI